LRDFLQKYRDLTDKNLLSPLPKLLSGDEIIEILNIQRGPLVGKIIAELKEAQMSGDVANKDEAVRFIKKFKDV
ncbi:MAG: hypothetical protein WC197_07910, partial [Candidatus Gastranaerophilaceae bacterium]